MYWNDRNDANIDEFTLKSWQGYASKMSGQAYEILFAGYDGEDAESIRKQADELAILSGSSDLSAIRSGYYALKNLVDAQKTAPDAQPATKQAEVVVGGFGSLLSKAGRR